MLRWGIGIGPSGEEKLAHRLRSVPTRREGPRRRLVFAGVEEVEESAPVGTARILARSDSFLAVVPNTDTRMEKWVC
ncbi:hypothetical protein [Desulfohalobium retbaense]|uniref:Uncharacterized protein n=1 Tax=Desulfohalobium retbaense (strain ATCC 49708 / DSM 5692 / JCM 16813 / HR100) TaxID=485915 RepID=C8X0A0_DESRD|nr:hypothetical protein [Desulfohalobium retbaense]ACV67725.1 hypothetical protein Dret_0428 [Desulfohalobium retbaense DSM 5692]